MQSLALARLGLTGTLIGVSLLGASLSSPSQEGVLLDVATLRAREGAELDSREALASAVQSMVRDLEKVFAASGQLPELDELLLAFSEDARACTEVSSLEERRTTSYAVGGPGRPVAVERFRVGELNLDEDSTPEEAALELRASYDELRRALGGPPTRPALVKVKEIQRASGSSGEAGDGDVFDLKLHLSHVRAPEGESAVGVHSWLRLRVREESGSPRFLGALLAPDLRTQSSGPAETEGFVDVAGSVFTDPRAALLRPSIPALRDLLDSGLGVGLLGHHGVAVVDLDSNGIEDIYLCQPGGIPNQLWVRDRDGTAREVAAAVGLDFADATTSALFVDLDGDGDRDACLGFDGSLRVFRRVGDIYEEAAKFERGSITGLAAADVNGDGLVDLYACAYANPYTGTTFPVPYHDAENGQENTLLLNTTREPDFPSFVDATRSSGLAVGGKRFSFAATFEDFDADGDMDLYVANDFGRNGLYVNRGDGTFTEEAEARGAVDLGAGMAASFADLDGDGVVDLYVANMASSAGRRITGQDSFQSRAAEGERSQLKRHAKGNTLLLGSPEGRFEESSLASAGRWAWGALPIDLDGNGALDLFVPNGFVTGSRGKAPDL